jgi:hypothetical protein
MTKRFHAKPQRRKEEKKRFTRSNEGTKKGEKRTLSARSAIGNRTAPAAQKKDNGFVSSLLRVSHSFFAALRLCVNPSSSGARA